MYTVLCRARFSIHRRDCLKRKNCALGNDTQNSTTRVFTTGQVPCYTVRTNMIFKGLFGRDPREETRNRYAPMVEKIGGYEEGLRSLSLEGLREKTAEFRTRLHEGTLLDDLLPEAFAVVREASRRMLGQRHYDVQLIGGAVLHEGRIAEMRTGEGKTLAATLPVYLNALSGKGVHVVTVNVYLARRDAVWMGQIYDCLGLTVGCITPAGSYLYDAAHTEG